jgi:single-strand DNA-binding protein
MAGYQYTIIIGNVGRDAELRYTPTGVAVCDFTVAVSRRWNDRNTNEQREKTTWFKVSAWRGLAETASQFVHKGMQIMVAGDIDASAFMGQDGQPRASLELTARDIKFLGRRGETVGEPGELPSEPEDLPF